MKPGMLKVGIIRCEQTEDMCPGTADFEVATDGSGVFKETGPVEVIGFLSCGGCPGKKAVTRAKMLEKRGADMVVFASCISKGTPIDFPCPHYDRIKKAVAEKLDPKTRILDWTH
ncbi:MAG: CGGC domain-containing protein [Candidatus Altiarchaeia archaeon]